MSTTSQPRMPRTYAVMKLLEHGPLSFAELKEITRWPEKHCLTALRKLGANHRVHRTRGKSGQYQLGPLVKLKGPALTQHVMREFGRPL